MKYIAVITFLNKNQSSISFNSIANAASFISDFVSKSKDILSAEILEENVFEQASFLTVDTSNNSFTTTKLIAAMRTIQ